MPAERSKLTSLEIIAVLTITIVRLGLYGFKYFPILDDWIQYGVYPLYQNLWHDVFLRIGLFATRPLAGIMDIYVWGQIPQSVAFFVITCLHAVSCLLFISTARRIKVPLGTGFVLIYMMLPINTEATIWLSASTRLVVPLFLTAVSLFILTGKKNLFFFWFTQLISLLFYEQIAVLSTALCFIVAFCAKKKTLSLIPIINLTIVVLYYMLFSHIGPFASRSALSIPSPQKINSLLQDIWDGGFYSHFILMLNGLKRGLLVLADNWWYCIFLAIAAVLVVLLTGKRRKPKMAYKLLFGFILAVIPFVPFLFISQPLSFRNFFPSLIGIGLIFDEILEYVPMRRVVAVSLALIFFVVSASEVTDYKNISTADKAYVLDIAKKASQPDFKVKRQVNLAPVNVLYGQHILSVTESDWALTGCMRALTKNIQFPTIKVE